MQLLLSFISLGIGYFRLTISCSSRCFHSWACCGWKSTTRRFLHCYYRCFVEHFIKTKKSVFHETGTNTVSSSQTANILAKHYSYRLTSTLCCIIRYNYFKIGWQMCLSLKKHSEMFLNYTHETFSIAMSMHVSRFLGEVLYRSSKWMHNVRAFSGYIATG